MSTSLIDPDRFRAAREALASDPAVSSLWRRTPLLRHCERLDTPPKAEGLGELSLKLESTQVLGSFKTRGVAWALAPHNNNNNNNNHNNNNNNRRGGNDADLPDVPEGVVSMSAGNFGRSLAYLAGAQGRNCALFMPETVPSSRPDAVRAAYDKGRQSRGDRDGSSPSNSPPDSSSSPSCSVELVPVAELLSRVDAYAAATGARFMHPFDDPLLFEGYGSIAAEIIEDLDGKAPDVVVVGVGGGGLISGVAAGLRIFGGKVDEGEGNKGDTDHSPVVIGVEPEGASSMAQSLEKGYAVRLDGVSTIAAGLAPPFAGQKCFEVIKQKEYVDRVVTVTDDEIRRAQRYLFDVHRWAFALDCAFRGAVSLPLPHVRSLTLNDTTTIVRFSG
jgi:threonine dehydratase